jgi:uncharacterized membrane protein YkoI
MRHVLAIAVVASLGLASCSSPRHEESKAKAAEAVAKAEEREADELDVRDLAAEAKVSLGQALETAMHAYPAGEPVAAELEGDTEGGKRSVAYEIAFVNAAGTEVHVVKVDHVTRKVVSSEKEDEADEAAEAMDRMKSAGAHRQRLLDLLHHAAQHASGAAVSVEYSRKHAGQAKVTFVKDHAETSVTLDAATGKVIESK